VMKVCLVLISMLTVISALMTVNTWTCVNNCTGVNLDAASSKTELLQHRQK